MIGKIIIGATAMSILAAPMAHADTNSVDVKAMMIANPGIANPDLIFPGEVLTVPGSQPYLVQPGDTLTKIVTIPGGPPPMVAPDGGIALPPPPPAPLPPPPPVPAPRTSGVNWDAVAKCESGGNWGINTGNGYEGGVQFLNSTWSSVKPAGAPAHAYQASKEQQIQAADALLHRSGIGQWPVCGPHGT